MNAPDHSGMPQRVVITGGSSGIGLDVARYFLEKSANVGIIGRDLTKLNHAAKELAPASPDKLAVARADVSDEGEVHAAVEALAEQLGGIDLVVASAGTDGETGTRCEEVTAASFREVLDVNVVGTFLAVKHTLPHLKLSASASVVIVGSDSGFVSVPGMLAYNASKGALVQLTRALAVELFDTHGIRVNSVCPSIVDTPMARGGTGRDSL